MNLITEPCSAIGQTPSVVRVLIVDDELSARKLLTAMLTEGGLGCTAAAGAEEALQILETEPVDAILTDLRMPGISGMELLARIRSKFPSLAFLMVTGEDDVRVGIEAMKRGAEDYLVKPLQLDLVLASLERALERKRLEQAVENYHRRLEQMVKERTRQLETALHQIEVSYEDTLKALAAAIDLRDSQTAGHSQRVALYSRRIAKELRFSEHELQTVTWGAWLHDIGKLAVPDAILLKPGPLTKEEWVIMRSHVQKGYDLVKQIPFLVGAAEIVLTHHERCDGSGYPRGQRGSEIPLGARVFAIADTLDAMTSDRPYRSALPFEEAYKEILRGAGRHFDLQAVNVFASIDIDSWKALAAI